MLSLFSEDGFVDAAVAAGHPKLFNALVPDPLRRVLEYHKNHIASKVASDRVAWFKYWIKRASALNLNELALKSTLAPRLQKLLAGKRLVLLREMLEVHDCPDMGVIEEIAEGTQLVGEVPNTGLFSATFLPASVTVEIFGAICRVWEQ